MGSFRRHHRDRIWGRLVAILPESGASSRCWRQGRKTSDAKRWKGTYRTSI